MMKKEESLVIVKDDDLYVGTWALSQGFGVEHRALTKRIKKYMSEFEEFNEGLEALKVRQVSLKIGSPFDEYLLNEEQATYLVTLLTNTDSVRKFKRFLTKEFFRQRKLLNKLIMQKQNAEWLEKRRTGKIERRLETDAIKEFIEYAKFQGSKNADKYYMIISKMENSALFNLDLLTEKFPNLRDVVDGLSLDALKMCDRIVGRCLREKMNDRMFYKDIFQCAKARVETFADSVGKMQLPDAETKMIS